MSDDNAVSAVESVGTRNDDLIADIQAIQNLHLLHTLCAESYRATFGNTVMDQIGEPGVLIHETAALDDQDISAFINQDPHRQALALSQAHRLGRP